MLNKRIIPCLDIQDGRTVKGTRFENIRDAGDPVELAMAYCRQGADELVFLDITATNEKRKTLPELVTRIAQHINIPFTVGGGISSADDVAVLLDAGADKISVNSAAVKHPSLIRELADRFGSQCVVLAIDTKHRMGKDYVHVNGGRIATEWETLEWAKHGVNLGAGEILLTAMDRDGTREGFAIDITRRLSRSLDVPVIASGGAGTEAHFRDVFLDAGADAALAAGIFHDQVMAIPPLKHYLRGQGIAVRL